MIIVKFESSSVWTEKSSTLFLTVFNSGPEDLYCTSEEYEPSGANPYILPADRAGRGGYARIAGL